MDRLFSGGLFGKGSGQDPSGRVPPGQHVTDRFPVFSAGSTPRVPLNEWRFTIEQLGQELITWTWDEFQRLPAQEFVVDVHCVTHWSKLDTRWGGVSVDTLFEHIGLDPRVRYVCAFCYGGYTTNLPLSEIVNGQAFVAYSFDGKPLSPEHGAPARLVVPHLYFWKSAKWIQGLRLMENDEPGYWERYGYHNHGDPWKEERFSGD